MMLRKLVSLVAAAGMLCLTASAAWSAIFIPEESSMTTGHVEEGWNVGIGLVFFPGCNTPYTLDYNRPLFNVADNGTMFLSPR